MSKTLKDKKEEKGKRRGGGEKPPPRDKGGHRNEVKEAMEEME